MHQGFFFAYKTTKPIWPLEKPAVDFPILLEIRLSIICGFHNNSRHFIHFSLLFFHITRKPNYSQKLQKQNLNLIPKNHSLLNSYSTSTNSSKKHTLCVGSIPPHIVV